ncbi:hypothetical protein PUR61_36150, partial [Streptomyces sp. BE20]|uniref:DUF7507 domain-containing protein n=1 Tax=Streptomyces sp. BE20 TaxID=3002525 RepID=UPI002E7DFC4A|nr:hypothetical protein [Streptomyces sp. BE20]
MAVGAVLVAAFPLAPVATAQSPALSLTQSVAPTTFRAAGQTITFSYLLANTGDEPLTAVTAANTSFSGTGTPPVVSCPDTSLAQGASMTCTAPYTVTQADVDAGRVTGVGIASGTPPTGSAVTAPDSPVTAVALQSAALSVEKTASGGGGGGDNRRSTLVATLSPGQTLVYSYLVKNTGNVTLTGVSVTDTSFSGTGTPPAITCPDTTLVPGQSMICSATYTVTQADADAGTLTNTATATGTPP